MDTDAVVLMTQTWKEFNAPWSIRSLEFGNRGLLAAAPPKGLSGDVRWIFH